MRTIARAFVAAALVFASACDNPGVTKPTTPEIPIGTPQSLTVEASPTTIPATAVTVQPGARMPGTLSVKAPQAKDPSLVPLSPEGKLDTYTWISQGGDIIV